MEEVICFVPEVLLRVEFLRTLRTEEALGVESDHEFADDDGGFFHVERLSALDAPSRRLLVAFGTDDLPVPLREVGAWSPERTEVCRALETLHALFVELQVECHHIVCFYLFAAGVAAAENDFHAGDAVPLVVHFEVLSDQLAAYVKPVYRRSHIFFHRPCLV